MLLAAFPSARLTRKGSVGWRGAVTAGRQSWSRPQVKVFGAWFNLDDASRILPVAAEVKAKPPRAPSGYNLFMKAELAR